MMGKCPSPLALPNKLISGKKRINCQFKRKECCDGQKKTVYIKKSTKPHMSGILFNNPGSIQHPCYT